MRTIRRIDLASLKVMFAVALAAMVVRAMVPSGWMIMPDPVTGQPSIQLCSGKMGISTPRTVTTDAPATAYDAHGGHHGHDMHGDAHAQHGMDPAPAVLVSDIGDHDHDYFEVPCPFSVSSVLSLGGDGFILLEPHVPAAADRAVPPVRGPPATRIIRAPLPARGPPSFV